MFSTVQDTVTETAAKMETVDTLVKMSGKVPGVGGDDEDLESLNSLEITMTPPSPEVIKKSRMVNKRVTLNVGGSR